MKKVSDAIIILYHLFGMNHETLDEFISLIESKAIELEASGI